MTNHAEEAEKNLYAAWEARSESTALSQHYIAEAQVHATLELAKQQRIANVIAMAQFSNEVEDGVRLFTVEEYAKKWRTQAREELGLS